MSVCERVEKNCCKCVLHCTPRSPSGVQIMDVLRSLPSSNDSLAALQPCENPKQLGFASRGCQLGQYIYITMLCDTREQIQTTRSRTLTKQYSLHRHEVATDQADVLVLSGTAVSTLERNHHNCLRGRSPVSLPESLIASKRP